MSGPFTINPADRLAAFDVEHEWGMIATRPRVAEARRRLERSVAIERVLRRAGVDEEACPIGDVADQIVVEVDRTLRPDLYELKHRMAAEDPNWFKPLWWPLRGIGSVVDGGYDPTGQVLGADGHIRQATEAEVSYIYDLSDESSGNK